MVGGRKRFSGSLLLLSSSFICNGEDEDKELFSRLGSRLPVGKPESNLEITCGLFFGRPPLIPFNFEASRLCSAFSISSSCLFCVQLSP